MDRDYPKWTVGDYVDEEGKKQKVSLIVQNAAEDEAVSSKRAVIKCAKAFTGDTYWVDSISEKKSMAERVKDALGV